LGRVRISGQCVCIPLAGPENAIFTASLIPVPVPRTKEHLMADVAFLGITIAFFVLLALIVKGVERLER
jgi:hypothetical protein